MKEFCFCKQLPVSHFNDLYNVLYDTATGGVFFGVNSYNIPLTYDEHAHVKEKLYELVKNGFFEEDIKYSAEMLEFI